jgi:hypothetical protein
MALSSNSRPGASNPNWGGGPITKSCQNCGKKFSVNRSKSSTAKYCSNHCRHQNMGRSGASNRHWKGGPVTISCQQCGKEFSVNPARASTAKYCSYTCLNRGRVRSLKVKNAVRVKMCQHCGRKMDWRKDFRNMGIATFITKKFCSKKCAVEGQLRYEGDMHPNYKSDARKKNRRGKENSWRNKVLNRDGFMCQICGAIGSDEGVFLTAHHIIPFADDKDERWSVSNGQTLCVHCHGIVHGYEGYEEINDDEMVVKISARGISRRVEVKCSCCGKILYKVPSDLIQYPSKQRKEFNFCDKKCMGRHYIKLKTGKVRTNCSD